MQIKTTMRYHSTPVRITIIKRQEITGVGKNVEKRKPLCTAGRTVKPLWKTVWTFLKNLKQNYHMIQQVHFWVFI